MFYLRLDNLNSNIVISYNNKLLKFKKINGKYVTCINNEMGIVSFTFHHEFDDRLWFLKAFVFYILSFFGLFMKRYSKCFYKLDIDIEFTPQTEGIYYDINLNDNHNGNPVVIVNGGEYNFLDDNKFILDERAKKNYHRFKIFSILTRTFVLIIVIIILIIFLI